MKLSRTLVVCLTFVAGGCTAGPVASEDGGFDSGAVVGEGGARDGGRDSGPDAGRDLGPVVVADLGTDQGTTPPPDAGPDEGVIVMDDMGMMPPVVDGGADLGAMADTGPGDSGPGDTGPADAGADLGAIADLGADGASSVDAGPRMICGDGTLDMGEICDDGNNANNDGCTSTCTLEGTSCAAAIPVTGTAGQPLVRRYVIRNNPFPAVSSPYFGDTADDCSGSDGAGPEAIFAITAPITGTLTFDITGPARTLDTVAYIRSDCADATATAYLGCSDDAVGVGSRVTTPITAGQTLFAYADSFTAFSLGNWDVQISIVAGPLAVGDSCIRGRTDIPCPAGSFCGEPDGPIVSTCQAVTPVSVGGACRLGSILAPCGTGLVCRAGTCQTAVDDGCGLGVRVVDLTPSLMNGVATISGDTRENLHSNRGQCGVGLVTAPEVAHRIRMPYDAEIRVESSAMTTFARTLYLRAGICTAATNETGCATASSGIAGALNYDPSRIYFEGQDVFVLVDGNANGAGGPYDATVRLRRVLSLGDTCDQASVANRCGEGTFCASTPMGPRCVSSAIDSGCGAGVPVIDLTASYNATTQTATYTGSTAGFANRGRGACTTGGSGPEVGHRFVMPFTGELRASVSATWTEHVYIRTGMCTSTSAEIGCSTSSPAAAEYSQNAILPQGTEVFIVVDGSTASDSGAYELTVGARRIVATVGGACDPLRNLDRCGSGRFCADDGTGPKCKITTLDSVRMCALGQSLVDLTSQLQSVVVDPMTNIGSLTISGNTAGLSNVSAGICGSSTGNGEIAHRFVMPFSAELRLERTQGFDGVTYVRRAACGDTSATAQIACSDPETIDYPAMGVIPGGTELFVFADGFGSGMTNNGQYSMTLRLRKAAGPGEACSATRACDPLPMLVCRASTCQVRVCGDGILEAPEECDDMNMMTGDGCNAMCRVEPSGPGGATCAAATPLRFVAISGTQRRAIASGTTVGETDDHQTTASCGASAGSPDVVYSFTTTAASTNVGISLTPGAGYNAVLHVHTAVACSTADYAGSATLGCRDTGSAGTAETTTLTALPAGTYYIVIDGNSTTNTGTFDLSVTTTP